MRHLDATPAWVTRQRNRLLGRRSDEKIVRWIHHRTTRPALPESGTDAASPSSNDNVADARAAQAR